MRANWKVTELQKIVSRLSPERLASWRALEDRPIAGRGVDIATGQVIFSEVDASIPGPPLVELSRTYCSGWVHRPSWLGRGWALSLNQQITLEPGGLVYRDGEGRELLFEHDGPPTPGLSLRHPLDPAELACFGEGKFRVVDRRGARLSFETPEPNGAARLRSIEKGVKSAFVQHDADGRPVEVAAGALRLQLLYMHGRLQITRLMFTDGGVMEIARYDYDDSGDLARVRLPHDVDRRYEYAAGLLVARGRVDGDKTYFGYDGRNSQAKCVRTWSHSGYDSRTLRYRRGATTVVDSTGGSHSFSHDPLYRPLETPDGRITYDDTRLAPLQIAGRAGRRTARLGPDGRAATIEAADGSVEKFVYDEAGRVIAFSDAGGAETTLRYGAEGTPVERAGDGPRTFVRQNEDGKTEIVVGDEWLVVERDGGERTTKMALRNEVWSARYDGFGRPTDLRGPEGDRRFEHDAYGRLTAVEIDGVRSGFRWDGDGRLVHARLPDGDWVIERDGGGLPRLVTRPDFACELFYDTEQRLTEVRDRRGRRWRFERDRSGRVAEEIDFDGRVHKHSYLGVTRLVGTLTHPDGGRLTGVRDRLGRLVEADHAGAVEERFSYDPAGRLVEAWREDRRVKLTRNRRGDVVGEQQGDDDVGANHDARGRRNLVVSSLGARITRQWGGHGERVLEITAPDGSRHEVRLDRRHLGVGRLLVERAPDRPPVRFSGEGEVERDAMGRVTGWVAPDGRTYDYGYGVDGLLSHVLLPDRETLRFEYDAFGRRVSANSEQWQARWVWDGGVALHEISSYAPPTLFVFDPADGSPIGKVQPGSARWLGLYQDFVTLFDPEQPEQPTSEYWPWRGGLSIDFLTGLWLGPGRAFHPRAAEPMGASSLSDELFGPAERRPFDYQPRATTMLERASDASLEDFLRRLTTPALLETETSPPAPWPKPIEAPRIVPRDLRV